MAKLISFYDEVSCLVGDERLWMLSTLDLGHPRHSAGEAVSWVTQKMCIPYFLYVNPRSLFLLSLQDSATQETELVWFTVASWKGEWGIPLKTGNRCVWSSPSILFWLGGGVGQVSESQPRSYILQSETSPQ